MDADQNLMPVISHVHGRTCSPVIDANVQTLSQCDSPKASRLALCIPIPYKLKHFNLPHGQLKRVNIWPAVGHLSMAPYAYAPVYIMHGTQTDMVLFLLHFLPTFNPYISTCFRTFWVE